MENLELLNYIKKAFEYKEQQCYKLAIEMLYKALSLEPDSTDILYQLGEIYFLMGNYTRAIQYPEQILADDKNNIQALKLLIKINNSQSNFYTAKEIAEKVYSLEPTEENLVMIIELDGRLGMCEDIQEYIPKIENSSKCLYVYSQQLQKNGCIDDGLKYIDMALAIEPENENYIIQKGKILFDKNDFNGAKSIFSRYNLNSSNPEILNFLGLFAMDGNNFIDAVKAFSKAVSLDKQNSKYYYNLGNAYFLNGWMDEATTAYKNAIYYSPENSDYRYSLGYLYYMNNDYKNAEKEADIVLSQNPNHPQANVLKAMILYQNKCYIDAETILSNNVNNGYEDDYTINSLAKIEVELAKYESARKHLETVILRNPDNNSYKCDLGEIYIREKNYLKAMDIADEINEADENYLEGYIIGAKAAYAAEDYDKLKNYAQNILSVDMNCSKGYYYLAIVRKSEKDYEEAIECLKRAILYDVNNAKLYVEMASLYDLQGDKETAFAYIKEAVNIEDSEEYKILYRKYASINRK